jgi:hypothetical protein
MKNLENPSKDYLVYLVFDPRLDAGDRWYLGDTHNAYSNSYSPDEYHYRIITINLPGYPTRAGFNELTNLCDKLEETFLSCYRGESWDGNNRTGDWDWKALADWTRILEDEVSDIDCWEFWDAQEWLQDYDITRGETAEELAAEAQSEGIYIDVAEIREWLVELQNRYDDEICNEIPEGSL